MKQFQQQLNQIFQPRAEVATVFASGVFRATIQLKYPVFLVLMEAVALAGVIFWGWEKELFSSIGGPGAVALLTLLNLVVLGYHMTASEVIEFDDRQMAVSRTNLGWQRTAEYPLQNCSKLEWRQASGNRPGRFRCKAGWRRVSFGKYLRQEQADRLIAELQTALPNVAKHLLGGTDPFQRHFHTLKMG